jgi:hypothetical protein
VPSFCWNWILFAALVAGPKEPVSDCVARWPLLHVWPALLQTLGKSPGLDTLNIVAACAMRSHTECSWENQALFIVGVSPLPALLFLLLVLPCAAGSTFVTLPAMFLISQLIPSTNGDYVDQDMWGIHTRLCPCLLTSWIPKHQVECLLCPGL